MSVAKVQKYENLPFNSINNKTSSVLFLCSFRYTEIVKRYFDFDLKLILCFTMNCMREK